MTREAVHISQRLFAIGNSAFLKGVVLPVAETCAEFPESGPQLPEDIASQISIKGETPQASGSELGGLVGVLFFIGSWAETKILDEFFDLKLRPTALRTLRYVFASGSKKRKYGLSVAFYNRAERITILIAAIGSNTQEFEKSEALIAPTLALAVCNAERSKASGIHLYVIDGGKCNAAPAIYSDLTAALSSLGAMKSAKPPRIVNL